MTTLMINNQSVPFDDDEQMPLLWFLRDEARLTGTKFGCGIAMCGACTVHLDGIPARACQTTVAAAKGKHITTIEGVGSTPIGQVVQDAWVALDVVQCGYCQSGQIMSAIALLTQKHNPDDADIDAAMGGNICRCATYARIRAAIHQAAKNLSEESNG